MKKQDLLNAATDFLALFYAENEVTTPIETRRKEIQKSINGNGTYFHTFQELEFGAKVAWRNSNRCIGRLYWKSLKVVDKRHLLTNEKIEKAIIKHIKKSTNKGAILPMITVFRQQMPNEKNGLRIHNSQLISYAAEEFINTENNQKQLIGDRNNLEFTDFAKAKKWKKQIDNFTVLPILFQFENQPIHRFEIPKKQVLEVPIIHPEYDWLADLNLKWYALPAISNMVLKIGGINYTAAPFSGWYMGTEVGARDLADETRYNQLSIIAKKMGLDTTKKRNLWKDKALIVLNEAVLFSYENKNVRMTDHHTASEHYMVFDKQETEAGRKATADWSWIVPPVSGGTTAVFHKEMSNEIQLPNFFSQSKTWQKTSLNSVSKCPFH
jgi:nitric-oxide synthase